MLDVAIEGGELVDGSGASPRPVDVGIAGGIVTAIGLDLSGLPARRRIEARGRIVCPGFIDMHSHAGPSLRHDDDERRAAANCVTDGVTTVVVNPDGLGGWPISGQLAAMGELGNGPNVITLVPHNTVRRRVLGQDAQRPASSDEIATMRASFGRGWSTAPWGLSTGLEYEPGRWTVTDEVAALVEEIVPFGGIYASHMRSEGRSPLWYVPSRT